MIDLYAQAGIAETQIAIDAASAAFPGWADTAPQQRFDILNAVADALASRQSEIGALLSREEGKTLREGVLETVRAANIFRFFAGECCDRVVRSCPQCGPGSTLK